eukprot:358618-Chlamydomonas_euryale.AAC.3
MHGLRKAQGCRDTRKSQSVTPNKGSKGEWRGAVAAAAAASGSCHARVRSCGPKTEPGQARRQIRFSVWEVDRSGLACEAVPDLGWGAGVEGQRRSGATTCRSCRYCGGAGAARMRRCKAWEAEKRECGLGGACMCAVRAGEVRLVLVAG